MVTPGWSCCLYIICAPLSSLHMHSWEDLTNNRSHFNRNLLCVLFQWIYLYCVTQFVTVHFVLKLRCKQILDTHILWQETIKQYCIIKIYLKTGSSCLHWVCHFLPLFSAPTGLSPPRLHSVNETTIQIDWDPPVHLNGPHPLYQVHTTETKKKSGLIPFFLLFF